MTTVAQIRAREEADMLAQEQHFGGDACSFDLTDFDNWPAFCQQLRLVFIGQVPAQAERNSRPFIWRGLDGRLILETYNNPETGEFAGGDARRHREPGYASYMGAYGSSAAIQELKDAVRQHASHVKGRANNRSYA